MALNALDLGNLYCYTNQIKTNNTGNTEPRFQNLASNDAWQLKFTFQLKTATPHTGHTQQNTGISPEKYLHIFSFLTPHRRFCYCSFSQF